ncbi:MAG: sarcosine oxidase subunit gamma [Pararhodobacter sp.]
MAELDITLPSAGLGLPITRGNCRLEAAALGPVWQIMPFPGARDALDAALEPLGLRFPDPGQVLNGRDGARLVWAGRETAFLIGAAQPPGLPAAVCDQSDGWVVLHLSGARVVDVLARLATIDLRDEAFPVASSARIQLNHLPAMIIKNDSQALEIWSYRSMAATLVHELGVAMRAVAARVTSA